MRTQLVAILMFFMLTSCVPRFIPKPDQTPVILTLPAPGEMQPALTSTQGADPTMASIPVTPITSNLQNLIDKAREDLSQRLSISTAQINIIDAKEVTWSNSSPGCPQPGMLYVEVLTPGYLIRLNTDNQDYEYHAGKGSDIFYCENSVLPFEGLPGNT